LLLVTYRVAILASIKAVVAAHKLCVATVAIRSTQARLDILIIVSLRDLREGAAKLAVKVKVACCVLRKATYA
jgi:hypothetical protein